ncbi:MAG: hypothetical protein ACREHG_06745 [Candidatus Saccharimonadales bacterium]
MFKFFNCSKTRYSTGRPCDENGNYLAAGAPASPFPDKSPIDWSPFTSRIAFQMAELLYKDIQMSAGHINNLIDLWAASLLKHGGLAPFKSHRDLYQMIDEAKIGDTPWSCFKVKHQGEIPADPPSWMTTDYDVWYRDPHKVIKNMVANTDFNGEMDTAPIRVYDKNGDRQYHNFMSGDWAWQQAVSIIVYHRDLMLMVLNRISSQRTLKPTVQCLCRSSSAVIRQQSPLPLVISSTTHYISQLGMRTMVSVAHIETPLLSLAFSPFQKVCPSFLRLT